VREGRETAELIYLLVSNACQEKAVWLCCRADKRKQDHYRTQVKFSSDGFLGKILLLVTAERHF